MITQWFYDSSVQKFHGLSTDTKPTNCTNGSRFIEIDTMTAYLFNAATSTWTAIPDATDYTNITNKPQINGVTLVGNKSFADLGLVSPMVLKGRVDDVTDLPSEAQAGWVYLVGIAGSEELEEYVYTEDGEWEFLGYNTLVIDSELSSTSENPVQNKVITSALDGLVSYDSTNAKLKKTVGGVTSDVMAVDTTPTANSKNPVTSGAVTSALALKADLSVLTPISESAYEALVTKDKPLYFIYD